MAARIHPARPTASLKPAEDRRLRGRQIISLQLGIERGDRPFGLTAMLWVKMAMQDFFAGLWELVTTLLDVAARLKN